MIGSEICGFLMRKVEKNGLAGLHPKEELALVLEWWSEKGQKRRNLSVGKWTRVARAGKMPAESGNLEKAQGSRGLVAEGPLRYHAVLRRRVYHSLDFPPRMVSHHFFAILTCNTPLRRDTLMHRRTLPGSVSNQGLCLQSRPRDVHPQVQGNAAVA